jgi:hypothetical protein
LTIKRESLSEPLLEEPDFDLNKLELNIPPNVLGYPWSKWACEQIALKCAEAANIPYCQAISQPQSGSEGEWEWEWECEGQSV